MKMNKIVLIAFLLLSISSIGQTSYAEKVNPFIGTGGHGHTYPGAVYPFGMVQPSPDTRTEGWDACSGYHYSDNSILGFSQTHLSGTGIADYCDILIMPTLQEPDLNNGYEDFKSPFSHNKEKAHAGYYSVFLEKPQMQVEITSSARVAHYKFTPQKESEYVYWIIDLKHRDQLLDHEINIIDEHNINGKRISKSWAQKQFLFYHLSTNQKLEFVKQDENGQRMVLKMKYAPEIQLKIALSPVSSENANLNLQKEIPHWNWKKTYEKNQAAWNKELSRIEYQSDADQETTFYTALYHNFIVPNLYQDVNGDYRSTDLKVHNDTSFEYYTVFSLWDTYRATHSLYALLMPERTLDFIKTLLKQYEHGGQLSMWELAGNYTYCMIGYHAVSVISEAYLKGITDFDTRLALKALISASQRQELGKPFFRSNQVMEINDEHESVSKQQEYSYDDYAIGAFAGAIGDNQMANRYLKSSKYYMNLINPDNQFVQPRMNGKFIDFDPTTVNHHYTEANGWQYNFAMAHDIIQYMKILGGADSLEAKLDKMFTTNKMSGRNQVDITGLIGQYAHGNEPSHHITHIYNFTNTPSKTQFYTQKIIKEFYKNAPDGLIGNEDCGQMSAWYVFNCLGFYPFVPASDYYTITSPSGKYAKINLENGNIFEIINEDYDKQESIYVKDMSLNGGLFERRYIKHESIKNGGNLKFSLSNKPQDESWKNKFIPTQKVNSRFMPLPNYNYENNIFKDSVLVSLDHIYDYVDIYYKIGESGGYKKFDQPFYISNSTNVFAYAQFRRVKSIDAKAQFILLDHGMSIEGITPYYEAYDGGHRAALIDGIESHPHYHSGFWQGFYDTSMTVVIAFDEKRTVQEVSAGFLHDPRTWIWSPKSMKVYGSKNGKKYFELGKMDAPLARDNQKDQRIEYTIDFPLRKKLKYIKVVAEYPGTIPKWHPGKGKPCFIFADEIIIR